MRLFRRNSGDGAVSPVTVPAVLVALALAAGCGTGDEPVAGPATTGPAPVAPGDTVRGPSGGGGAPATTAAGDGAPVRTSSSGRSGGPPPERPGAAVTPPASVGSPPTVDGRALDDHGPLGSAAGVLLGPSAGTAVLEIDGAGGRALSAQAAQALEDALRRHGGKRSVQRRDGGDVPAQDVYTIADLRRIARQHRRTESSADAVAVHVLVLPGRFEQARVTGVAFEATTFALFPERISSGLLGLDYEDFEEAVAVHELGHLFGLVDLTGAGAFHEDPEHEGHSRNRTSVMYWAIEDVELTTIFNGGPPRGFDADDVEEMRRIRG